MIFKIFNLKIKIEYGMLAFLAFIVFIDKSNFLFLGILAALIHEIGHLIFMKKTGYDVNEISFNLFNANILDLNRVNRRMSDDILILVSGPFFNLIFFILFLFLYKIFLIKALLYFSFENLFLCVFNLLPIHSLDGGQLLFLLLLQKFSLEFVCKVSFIVSVIGLYLLTTVSFYTFFTSEYNFSLLVLCFYLSFKILNESCNYI
mgnify:FL=1